MNRRKFLLGASAVVAVAVAKASMPRLPIAPYVDDAPEWMARYPGWILPRGQTLVRAQYSELFAALGETFGSDGPMTFRAPDMRTDVEGAEPLRVQEGSAMAQITRPGSYVEHIMLAQPSAASKIAVAPVGMIMAVLVPAK